MRGVFRAAIPFLLLLICAAGSAASAGRSGASPVTTTVPVDGGSFCNNKETWDRIHQFVDKLTYEAASTSHPAGLSADDKYELNLDVFGSELLAKDDEPANLKNDVALVSATLRAAQREGIEGPNWSAAEAAMRPVTAYRTATCATKGKSHAVYWAIGIGVAALVLTGFASRGSTTTRTAGSGSSRGSNPKQGTDGSYWSPPKVKECPTCHGRKRVLCVTCGSAGKLGDNVCPRCQGYREITCTSCGGSGTGLS